MKYLFGHPPGERLNDLFGVGTAVAGVAGAVASAYAANKQYEATKYASDLSKQSADASLGFNKDVFNKQQENQAPWLQSGKTALGQLDTLTAPGGGLTTPYGKTFDPGKFEGPQFKPYAEFNGGPAFKAPTGADFQNDPGYQFRLEQGQKALERSAAAKGSATGGAAIKAAQRYGQDYASNEYGNVYGRALGTYQTNFGNSLAGWNANSTANTNNFATDFNSRLNQFNTNANTGQNAFNTNYNVWNQDQGNQFNRLASLAGMGQAAVGQLNQSGSQAAANVSGIQSNLGNNLSSLATQGGNAIAAGAVGVGNAITSAWGNYQQQQQLNQILAARQSGYGTTPNWETNGVG